MSETPKSTAQLLADIRAATDSSSEFEKLLERRLLVSKGVLCTPDALLADEWMGRGELHHDKIHHFPDAVKEGYVIKFSLTEEQRLWWQDEIKRYHMTT